MTDQCDRCNLDQATSWVVINIFFVNPWVCIELGGMFVYHIRSITVNS